MDKLIATAGHVAAIVGTLVCVVAGAARVANVYEIAGVDSIALFTVGIGGMVFACLAKLHVLTAQLKRG